MPNLHSIGSSHWWNQYFCFLPHQQQYQNSRQSSCKAQPCLKSLKRSMFAILLPISSKFRNSQAHIVHYPLHWAANVSPGLDWSIVGPQVNAVQTVNWILNLHFRSHKDPRDCWSTAFCLNSNRCCLCWPTTLVTRLGNFFEKKIQLNQSNWTNTVIHFGQNKTVHSTADQKKKCWQAINRRTTE